MQTKDLQMKRTLRTVLFVLLLGVVGMTKGYAYDFSAVCETGQTLYYSITDAENHYVELTCPGDPGWNGWDGYTKPTGDIILPEEVEYDGVTYTLTTIGDYAFYDCTGLTSVGIPNTVTSMGYGVFDYCSGLTWVSLPDSITNINSYTFENCSNLTSIYIPDSVTTIGEGAFSYCTGLTSIHIPDSLTTIGNMAFCYCMGLTSIEIPNSVTTIGNSAFEDCSGLTSIEIPSSVMYIGSNPFRGCRNLEQIIVASDNVYYDSRENCNAIIETNTNVLVTGCNTTVIPNSVTSIGESAFYDCSGLTSIDIPNSVTSIGDVAFYGCNNLTSMVIPNSVFTIGEGAFEYCYGLTELDFGNSLASIGGYAFYNCYGLTSIELPYSLTSLGSFAFHGCNGLTSIEIPGSVTVIETNPFASCRGLEQVVVASDNAYYDSRENCNAIIETNTNVLVTGCRNTVIPNPITSIGNCAFYGCYNLVSIEIPNGVTSIGGSAFYQCSSLTLVTLGDFVTSIGNYAFRECTKLTSVTIGNSIASIGEMAFYSCSRLSTMTVLAETAPSIGRFAFDYVPTTIPIYVPCSAVEDYQAANGWRRFTNFIGLCSGYVSVTVNPSEGGSATGAGYYNAGDICVLTATANPGFVFANWMENGRLISMESVCSIYAHPTTIVANFCLNGLIDFEDANVKALCVSNWDINGDGELSYAEAAAVTDLGQVFRYNSTITSFDELQYFISLNTLRGSAFYGCGNLTSITLPNSVTAIYSSVFYNCNNLTSIEIPSSVLSIGSNAFYNCSSLTSVNLGSSVASIGEDAFRGCSSLTSIEIPSSVTNMVANPFASCRGLVQITVDSGNTVYDSRENSNAIINTSTNALVAGCKNTVIPNTVTTIGNYAFFGCSGLTSIEISNSVTTIGDDAFYYCSSLNSVTIGNSVTSIGALAFYHCSALTSVTMGNSVTSIGNNAFMDCTGLVSIEISNSVTSIGVLAFNGCSGLSSITVFAETPPALGRSAFSRVNKSIPVYVPCGSLEAYQNADGWGEFTNIQEICEQQTIELSAGWNWVSLYVEFEDAEQALQAFEAALGEHGLKISSVDDFTTYADGEWGAMGDLEEMTNDLMYMVLVDEDIVVTLEGMPSNPSNYSITINPGWTWIGFPSPVAIAVEVAFADFEAEEGDKIMGVDGYSIYGDGEWNAMGDLEELTPGSGYMYFSNSTQPKTLVIQSGAKAKADSFRGKRK